MSVWVLTVRANYFQALIICKGLFIVLWKVKKLTTSCNLAAGNLSVREKAALKKGLAMDGLTAHDKQSNCTNGCPTCKKFRQLIEWPPGIPLESNLAKLSKDNLEIVCQHYKVDVYDAGKTAAVI